MLELRNELAWAEYWLNKPGVPAESFPGDEVVYGGGYAKTFSAAGARAYDMTRLVLASAHAFGADLGGQPGHTTLERVKRMMGATDQLDSYLDQQGLDDITRVGRHTTALEIVPNKLQLPTEGPATERSQDVEDLFPELHSALQYWGNSVHARGDERQAMSFGSQLAVSKSSKEYLAFGLRKFNASSMLSFSSLIYNEGERYGHLWADTAWADQPELGVRYQEYRAWMGAFVGRVAQAKAAFELRKDHGDRNASFKPPVLRGARILLQASIQDGRLLKPALAAGSNLGIRGPS